MGLENPEVRVPGERSAMGRSGSPALANVSVS